MAFSVYCTYSSLVYVIQFCCLEFVSLQRLNVRAEPVAFLAESCYSGQVASVFFKYSNNNSTATYWDFSSQQLYNNNNNNNNTRNITHHKESATS
jgi:hypothetical protein